MNNEKQLERQHRQKQFRRRLTALSWAVPVFAFGGFFSVWHSISSAVNPPAKSMTGVSATSNLTKPTTATNPTTTVNTTSTILFKTGTRNPQVRTIQEQLFELGYFNHAITNYYGPVTAQAVQAFQAAKHLNPTGQIDNTTLTALQQAVKGHQITNLTTTRTSVTSKKVSDTNSKSPTRQVSSSSSTGTKNVLQSTPKKSTTATAPTAAQTTSSASVSSQSTSQTRSSAS